MGINILQKKSHKNFNIIQLFTSIHSVGVCDLNLSKTTCSSQVCISHNNRPGYCSVFCVVSITQTSFVAPVARPTHTHARAELISDEGLAAGEPSSCGNWKSSAQSGTRIYSSSHWMLILVSLSGLTVIPCAHFIIAISFQITQHLAEITAHISQSTPCWTWAHGLIGSAINLYLSLFRALELRKFHLIVVVWSLKKPHNIHHG